MECIRIFTGAAVPGGPLLIYLTLHATEGWQLLVVAAFLACFVIACLRTSKPLLIVSYTLTCSLRAWVAWVNL
jgi:hypothetical protein